MDKTSNTDDELLKVSTYLTTLLKNVPVGVAILEGYDFRYLNINQTLADLNGLSIEEHLGKKIIDILPHASEVIVPELKKIIKTGIPILNRQFDIYLPCQPDVLVNLVDWQIPITLNNSESTSIISIVVDVTQLTDAQAKLVHSAKLASIGELTAGLAHELNQPLGIIQGRVHMMEELLACENLSNRDKIINNIKEIEKEVDRASKIIKHLKTFSRQELEGQRRHVDVEWLVNESFILINETLRIASIKIEICIDENLPQLKCDYIKFVQVITNLLSNAKDALIDAEEKFISLRAYLHENLIHIEIRDTGIGMTDNIKNRIFEPFFTTKPVGEGTGLGLSICYGFIKEYGGTINVTSEIGQGSTFAITLPIE